MVLPFALLALAFHAATALRYCSVTDILGGALIGLCVLYLIRQVANHLYQADSLGLGDVKLMGAAGLWLGVDTIALALATGAFAGLIHGFIYGLWQARQTGEKPNFSQLHIPAGPGFAVGIVIGAIVQFQGFNLFAGL